MVESDYTRCPPAIEQNLTGQKSTENAISDDINGHSGEENQEVLPEIDTRVLSEVDEEEAMTGGLIGGNNLGETTQIQKQNYWKERKCFFCKKKRHLKSDCLKYKKYLDLSQHIEIKYLVVREKVRVLVVSIEHISRKLMIVVTLTKGLSLKWFVEHVAHMNLTNMYDALDQWEIYY
ncbi:hypothetical protein AMTRI_Chr11g101600 [Amborella trichopoda]